MSLINSFITELRIPVDLIHTVATRVVTECPQLLSALRRTSWLASPTGHYEFRSRLWFDDQRYHAIVMARTVIDGQSGDEFVFSRHGKHFTYKPAVKTAQLATTDAATFRVFTAQK